MSFYYSREAGAEGTIYTIDGRAPGQDLATLLRSGRPPLRACLEIGSAIADILTIAEEDQAVHGDISPEHVYIEPSGAVSVSGYGATRRNTRAPEGRPSGPLTDVFGLGVVMHSLLSSSALGLLPRDPDAHDDAVVDRVMEMDFGGLEGRRWLDDARRFLCTIMAFDPHERPVPLDAANVLASVADQAPGTGLPVWASQTSRAAAAPEAAPARPAPSAAASPEPSFGEDLGGPRNLSAPMPRGGIEARQAPASKGQTTQMWTKERLAAFIQEDEEEDQAWQQSEGLSGPTPSAAPDWRTPQSQTGWEPTAPPNKPAPWTQAPGTLPHGSDRAQDLPGLEPPPLGQHGFDPEPPARAAAPRPQAAPPLPPAPHRRPPAAPPRPPAAPPRPSAAPPRPPTAPPRPPAAPPRPPAGPSRPAGVPPRPPAATPRSPAPPPAAAPPAPAKAGRSAPPRSKPSSAARDTPAGAPPVAWSPDQQAEPEEAKGGKLKWVLAGAALLAFLCLGGLGIGFAAWSYILNQPPERSPIDHSMGSDPLERTKAAQEPVDTNPLTGGPKPEPREKASSREPAPATSAPARERAPDKTSPRTGSTPRAGSSGGSSSGSSAASSSSKPPTEPQVKEPVASVAEPTGNTGGASMTDQVTGGSYDVKVSLQSKKKASVRCGDGQSMKFSGAVRMQFAGTVTCVFEADGARGAVTIDRGGKVSCGITGGDIFCSGPS